MLFFNQLGEILTSEMLSLILICIVFLGCLYQLYSRR
ncbi:serine protease, partial [Staphylococcus pseudintermedius]|nr:serine protease [Staphylococcus pseudintermedius]